MINLSNYFLVSAPNAHEDVFMNSVVCVTEHGTNGAVGVMVNKPIDSVINEAFLGMSFSKFKSEYKQKDLYFGGPVGMGKGFVLHNDNTQDGGGFLLTNGSNIFERIETGGCQNNWLVSVGYSAWDSGQLEAEIGGNQWLVVKAGPELIFDVEPRYSCNDALRLLGINDTSRLYCADIAFA